MSRTLAHIHSTTVAAAAATLVFCVLIGPSMAIWTMSMGRPVSAADVLGLGAFSLLFSPLILLAFLFGTAVIGPAGWLASRRLGFDSDAAAMLTAASASGIAAYLLLGSGVPGGNPEIVAPLAMAGGAAGIVYRRWVGRLLTLPPAPPA